MKLTKIGDFLRRSKIPIDILDDKEYKRVTIRINHNGVSLRDTEIGNKIGTKKQFILKNGQFIVSKIDARYGAFGIAPNEVDGAIITGNFWAYDVDFSKLNIEWFNQFTNSPDFYDLCERASSGITHRKYLNEAFFLNYEILLPSVDEQLEQIEQIKQKKISFGNLSSEFTNQLNLIKQLRQSFLREAMQGKLVSNKTKDSKTGAELLAEIQAEKEKLIKEKKIKKSKPLPPISKEEIPFEIPENWVWCRLGEICNYGSSKKIEPNKIEDDVWSLDLEDIEKNTSRIIEKVRYKDRKSTSTKNLFLKNQVLYSKLRPNLDKVIVADENGVCTTEIVTIDFYIDFNSYFLKYYFKSNYFINYVVGCTKGMKMPRVGTEEVRSTFFPLPPLEIQERIVSKLDELMQFCDHLENSVKESQKLNEQLLQQVLREALQPKTKEVVLPLVAEDREEKYDLWLSNQGLAARGTMDEKTLREIFDAMDDEDK